MKVSAKRSLRVCYFGTYSMEEGYPRNRVIIEGLRRNGVDVAECHEDFWEGTTEKLEGVKHISVMWKTLLRLLQTYRKLTYKYRQVGYYDAIIVGYAGHFDIFLAKFLNLFRRKPVIFDAFLSLYDTSVIDRGVVPSGSFKAGLLRLIDTWACRVADAVLLDTQAHIDYFVSEFHLPPEKFFAVPVGSALPVIPSKEGIQTNGLILDSCFRRNDDLRSRITDTAHEYFTVLYFGSYIPLHGVDVILKAARILQDNSPPFPQGERKREIAFTLVGAGQLLPEMKQLASDLGLKNVNFVDRFVGEEELTRYILKADICLGIFGQTDKALRVIPCKVYNCLAMGKPLITARTEATEGILTHMDNAILCKPGDAEDLAKAILFVKNDAILRDKVARRGKEYFMNNFSSEAIGKKVRDVIYSVLKR